VGWTWSHSKSHSLAHRTHPSINRGTPVTSGIHSGKLGLTDLSEVLMGLGNGHGAVAVVTGWEGNRRFGVAIVMRCCVV